MDEESVGALVRDRESKYVNGNTNMSKYVNFSMYENIEKIEAYLNSKHISGEVDAMGREKPFFNIVTAATNIWYRATDIDRKDIKIKSTKNTDVIAAYLATIHLQEFMKKDAFGVFLNEWGRSLARYGSSMVKFIEKSTGLHAEVIPWSRLIVDAVDVDNDVKIERLFYTPAQLLKRKGYNKEKVKELINASKAARKLMGGQNQDNNSEYIPVYEVHGELPLSTLKKAQGKKTSKEDDDVYVQQMHVVSFVAKEGGKDNEYDEYTLACGRETKDPYMITHLIKEDGRSQAIGAVEHLFESQWMVNHTAKAIKDMLDLSSKLIFQTSDPSFAGQNALDSIETGDILLHSENNPLTQVANTSHDVQALQSFGNQWVTLAQSITSTPDAITGNNMPANTPYALGQLMNTEAHSLFELMTENKGLAIEEMCREYIIPYLVKQMDTTDQVSATLDAVGINKIDLQYINSEYIRRNNKHLAEQMFNNIANKQLTPLDPTKTMGDIQNSLSAQGSQRFFAPSDIPSYTWKELFKDFVWDAEVDVTNEQSDKNTVLTTLNTVLTTIASNPMILQDPNARLVFNKILETTGTLSPMELQPAPPIQPTNTAQPTPTPTQKTPQLTT